MSRLHKYTSIALAVSLVMSTLAVGLIIPASAAEASPKEAPSGPSFQYTNSDWGVQMSFPPGWTGKPAVTSSPKEEFSVTVTNNMPDQKATIVLEGWHKKIGKPADVGDWLHRQAPDEFNCIVERNNPTPYSWYGITINLNGMKVIEIVEECSLPGVEGTKWKVYGVETADKVVMLAYFASSGLPTAQYFWPGKIGGSDPNNFAKFLDAFEDSAKNFKVSWAPMPQEELLEYPYYA